MKPHQKPPASPLLDAALRTCRGGFAVLAGFSFFLSLLMLTVPLYMLQVFDRVLVSRSTDTLVLLTVVAGGALLTLAALDAVRGLALLRIGTWLERSLGPEILSSVIGRAAHSTGAPSAQALRDLAVCRSFLTGPSVVPALDAPWAPIFVAVVFLLHPVLGWLGLAGGLALLALAVINERSIRGPLDRAVGAQLLAQGDAEAAARNADAVEAMGMVPGLIRRWRRSSAVALEEQARASGRTLGIAGASKFTRLALQLGMLGTGALLVIEGQLTPGGMIGATILIGRALAPLEQTIAAWKAMVGARQAYARVRQALADARPRGVAMSLPTPRGALRVEGLSFAYPGAAAPSIRGLDFDLPAGSALGLIGPTASGKTTLSRLLVGTLKPQAGHVRLDGMDIAEWEPEDRGRHVGYLPQVVELFRGSVRDNIARFTDGPDAAVIEAARLAGVHQMVLGLPQGYQTEIGEAGTALSGGQRQRIALARALYGDPRFLVLDEPNANLDQSGVEALLGAIGALKERGVTLIAIAHQPSVLRLVDYLLVLKDGAVQMAGPRDEIMPKVVGPDRGVRDAEPSGHRRG